jgi:glycosyltransferase involved in cell wall biosynthesis
LGQVVLATPASTIWHHASIFETQVLNRLPEDLRGIWDVWHIGLSDADALVHAPDPSVNSILVAHDPEKIIGLPHWRPLTFSPAYFAWRVRAQLSRRRLLSRFLDRFSAIVVTSHRAAATSRQFGFASYIGPLASGPEAASSQESPPILGVMGHLHPSRRIQDIFLMARDLPEFQWEIVGRTGPVDYLGFLLREAPANVRVYGELTSEQLWNKVRNWSSLVVLPNRARSLGASQAVVDCMTLGIPILYPDNAQVIAEYVGAGGRSYIRHRLADAARALQVDRQGVSSEAAKRAHQEFSWDVARARWTEYLRAIAR